MVNQGRSSLRWITLATSALLLVAGCQGFWVNPSLTAVAVSPAALTLTAETGTPPTCPSGSICTQQMTAIGTFSDGTQSTVAASWQSSDITIATVSSAGFVTAGVGTGQATITAAAGTFTGTGSVTVTPANLVKITVQPGSAAIRSGGTQQFTAMGTLSDGSTVDVTKSVTWASSNTSAATISNGTTGGLATAATVTTTQTTNITAAQTSTSGTITSVAAVLTVSP